MWCLSCCRTARTDAFVTFREWQANFDANKDEYERDPLLARVLNDQMSKLDRTFILEQGLPNRPGKDLDTSLNEQHTYDVSMTVS